MENRADVTELRPGIFQIRGLNGSSHSYVIKGNYKNVMIDSGSDQNFAFKAMRQQLRKIPQTTSINGAGPPERREPARAMIDPKDIAEGSPKLVRTR
jgi:hypothetical protein